MLAPVTYFNPRFPRGKRLKVSKPFPKAANFNPRFPRGKRRVAYKQIDGEWKFQSTLPAGEATYAKDSPDGNYTISIHASRGGSDSMSGLMAARNRYFNPRFPRGKRHVLAVDLIDSSIISIHASRGGSDLIILGSKKRTL